MKAENRGRLRQTAGLCLVTMILAGVPGAVLQAADETLEQRLERMEQTIRQQQADLEAQRQLLEEQSKLIRQLQSSGDSGRPAAAAGAEPQPAIAPAAQPADAGAAPSLAAGTQAAPEDSSTETAVVAESKPSPQAGQPGPDSKATLYDRSSTAFDPDFPGAWHLPGTTAAMKIGGYVNLAIAHSFDPIGSEDSFIVGSIPRSGSAVRGPGSNTFVSADQTRANLEVREHTDLGTLRAFVEGDFRGDGSTFRLRHAYGQFAWLLAGKTWSTFADVDALPDELDFEGVNGSILQRQSQLRFFPRLGTDHNFIFAIEEPATEIQNGTGFRGAGDLIVSIDRLTLGEKFAWNYKVAAVYRDLKGQRLPDGSGVAARNDSTTGWGITTSGKKTVAFWGDGDFIQWQLTYGEGIGHYINDLATLGGGDAVFDPEGNLRALPVFAGFLSYNHNWLGKPWFFKKWPGEFQSNLMFSWVDVDNYNFQADGSYNRTWRASANMFYFPIKNIRLGAEILWGKRTNKDDTDGTATQFQVGARYSY